MGKEMVSHFGLKVRGSTQILLADDFLSPPALPLNAFCLPHPTAFPSPSLFSKSHAPSAVASVLTHLSVLISSSAGKCFGGWQPNLSAYPMFLNSSSRPSGCCPCTAVQAEQEEGRWGWTRPGWGWGGRKKKGSGCDPGTGNDAVEAWRALWFWQGFFFFFFFF